MRARLGIGGVIVTLTDANGGVVATTRTTGDGTYSFVNVPAGAYTVRETDPAGYVSTTANSVPVNMAAGGSATANFGDQPVGSLGGVVFNDLNGNGTQEAGEPGIGGVFLTVLDSAGTVITTTTTVGNGGYLLLDLPPGTYTVVESDPVGFVSTTPNSVVVSVPAGGSGSANFGDNAPVVGVGQAVLVATKSASLRDDANNNGQADPGDRLGYTIVIRNTASQPAVNVRFTDTPDPNTTLVPGSVQNSAGTITGGNGGQPPVTVDAGTIASGSVVTITFEVTINAPLPAGVTQVANQGTVTADNAPATATDNPVTPIFQDATVTPVVTRPVLAAIKEASLLLDADGNGAVSPGDTLLYRVSIRNQGTAPATAVMVEDTPDAHTTLVTGSVIVSTGAVITGNGSGDGRVRVEISTLAPGAGATITFRVTINRPLAAGVNQIRNQGTVSSAEQPLLLTDDPGTAPVGDATLTPVVAEQQPGQPALSLEKRASLVQETTANGIAEPGETLLYQIRLHNSGSVSATGVALTDTPDANTTLVVGSVQSSLGTVITGNGGGDRSVRVDVGTIPAGGTVTVSFAVRINDPLPAGVMRVGKSGHAAQRSGQPGQR